MTEEYADYLPEGVARGTPREYLPPEPGTGQEVAWEDLPDDTPVRGSPTL